MVKTDVGVYLDIEPVYVTNLGANAIAKTMESAITAGVRKIKHPTLFEIDHWSQPVLKAAKISSWKKFAQNGAFYLVDLSGDEVTIILTTPDKQGRFMHDVANKLTFPKDTSLQVIAQAILENAATRNITQLKR